MQTEWIIAVLAAVCVVFFMFQKKNPPGKIKKAYNIEVDAAREFQLELERVADLAVRNTEEKISRLDYLIKEAQEKSDQLDAKIKLVNDVIGQINDRKDELSLLNQMQEIKEQMRKQEQSLPQSSPTQVGNIEFIKKVQRQNAPSLSGANHNAAEKELLNNEKHRAALTMLREGYNVLDIAKVTGLGKGEVMLLQGLRDRKE